MRLQLVAFLFTCVATCSAYTLLASRPSCVARAVIRLASGPVPIEFSRPRPIAGLRKQASRFALEATPEECAALAKRFELGGLRSLAANVSLAVIDPRRPRVRAYGSFDAFDVIMKSGLQGDSTTTLQAMDVSFETFFSGDAMVQGKYDVDEADDAYDEEIEDGQIDLGELVSQHLYLYLSELELTKFREFSSEYEPGEIVFDSDPD